MTEQEYLLARGALDGLHKIYRFACVDRMVPMPGTQQGKSAGLGIFAEPTLGNSGRKFPTTPRSGAIDRLPRPRPHGNTLRL